jgi:hypothetical protein
LRTAATHWETASMLPRSMSWSDTLPDPPLTLGSKRRLDGPCTSGGCWSPIPL